MCNYCKHLCVLFISALFFLAGCGKPNYSPKPMGFYRFDYPVSDSLVQFSMNVCDFTFRYPDYILIEKDTLFFDEKPDHPCWLNLKYKMLNGTIHMSYKPLKSNSLVALTEDYHTMKNKHVIKASFIDEAEIKDEKKHIYGLISEVGGNVASAYQFYITDSSEHFLRGALYFKTEANADSLKPAVEFVKEDIIKMLHTWKWK